MLTRSASATEAMLYRMDPKIRKKIESAIDRRLRKLSRADLEKFFERFCQRLRVDAEAARMFEPMVEAYGRITKLATIGKWDAGGSERDSSLDSTAEELYEMAEEDNDSWITLRSPRRLPFLGYRAVGRFGIRKKSIKQIVGTVDNFLAESDTMMMKFGRRLVRFTVKTPSKEKSSEEPIQEFELSDEDWIAIDVAKNVARRLLDHPAITSDQVVGIGHALKSLERLPRVTESYSEFGIVYRAGTEQHSEMRYVTFEVSGAALGISRGGSVYVSAVGGDTFSEPEWRIEINGYRETDTDISNIEDSIEEYLSLGAELSVHSEGAPAR